MELYLKDTTDSSEKSLKRLKIKSLLLLLLKEVLDGYLLGIVTQKERQLVLFTSSLLLKSDMELTWFSAITVKKCPNT